MAGSGNPEYFATVVKARREKLGLTMAQVGTVAVPTLVKIEAGKWLKPQAKTFAKLDAGLKWKPGSAAAAYWDAEPPEPIKGKTSAVSPLRTGEAVVEVPLERVLALMGVQQGLNAAADSAIAMPAPAVRELAARLNHEMSYVVGRWATDMLERNRSQGANHPGLETALADALAAPVDHGDPDAEERWYRRWLLGGRHAASVDDALREKFEQRYEDRYQERQRGGENDDQ